MNLQHGLTLLTFTLTTLAGASVASAATANCTSRDGTCDVSNDGFDWIDCMCADGSGINFGGLNEWAGLSEAELQPICEEQLAEYCGPFVPPDEFECLNVLGSCTISNNPEDSVECECYDGSTGGVAGGNAWADYSFEQLFAECGAQLGMYCEPPRMSLECSNTNGECTLSNVPADFLTCQCYGGGGSSMSGGNAWAGHSELELHGECGIQLVDSCGGPLPPPPWLECSSGLGSCSIDNHPASSLECTCADGEMFSGGEGKDWSGLSNDELFTLCEAELYEGCAVEGGSDTGDTGSTTSGDSTGVPGTDTALDGSSTEGSDGPPPSNTTGDDTTGSGPNDGDGGAVDGEGGGCSCSANDSSRPGWALALLGLVGLTRRRRRAA